MQINDNDQYCEGQICEASDIEEHGFNGFDDQVDNEIDNAVDNTEGEDIFHDASDILNAPKVRCSNRNNKVIPPLKYSDQINQSICYIKC